MLCDFFRINLPYGMEKNKNGEWSFFNREYVPLGWNSHSQEYKQLIDQLPIHTTYTKLTEATLEKLAWHPEDGLNRDESGKIVKVWFYNDRTNPMNDSKYWGEYFDRLKLLSKCEVKSTSYSN